MNYQKRKKPKAHGFQNDFSREDWLAWRNTGIGGSDAGVATGVHPYKSSLDLYLEKRKGIRPHVTGLAVSVGNDLEDYVIRKAQELHPDRVRALEVLPMMSHPELDWMLATCDAGVSAGSHGLGIIEAKTALSKYGHMGWIGGNIPAHYRAQVVHYLAVTGRKWGIICALTEGPNWYSHIIEPKSWEIDEMIEAELRLWNAIQSDDLAFLIDDSERCTKALAKLFPEAKENNEIDLRGNEKAEEAIKQYLTSKRFEKAAAEDKKESENILKSLIGEAELAHVGDCEIKWTNTARGRRFSVKEL